MSEVRPLLPEGFEYISHADISYINFEDYEYVFLFSWVNDVSEMQRFIQQIPPEKLVFISTMAVYAELIANQYSKYPKLKSDVELFVLSKGSSVMRLGIFDEKIGSYIATAYPYTSYKMVADALSGYGFSGISEVYHRREGRGKTRLLHQRTRRFLMSVLPIRFALDVLFIFLKKPVRNYTYDLLYVFSGALQAGYGALGGYFANSDTRIRLVIVSGGKNRELNERGFRKTLVPEHPEGAGHAWHGVKIVGNKKKVPFIVKRFSPPRHCIKANVISLNLASRLIEVRQHKNSLVSYFIPYSNLVLALGAIKNTSVLTQSVGSNSPVTLNDHEIGYLGSVDSKELCARGFIARFGFVAFNKSVLRLDNAMFDFRPIVRWPPNIEADVELLANPVFIIIRRLLKDFSWAHINQAVFNKFGIGICTKRMAVFGQLLVRDCVQIGQDGLHRSRLNDSAIKSVQVELSNHFDSFVNLDSVHLVDGLHYQGGSILLRNSEIQNEVESGRLIILGSPTTLELDETHNTVLLREAIDEQHR